MSFEAYSVGIKLRLIDGVSVGLLGLAAQFAGFNKHVSTSQAQLKEFETRLKSIKTMAFVGGAATGIGLAGLYAFKAPIEEAKAWAQESAKFASLGFGPKVNSDAQTFALGMKTYGTSARENLTLLSDSMAVFKDLGNAKIAAPILAKMKFANEAVFGSETGGGNERQFMDMLKVIEFRRGLSSPAEFQTQANFVQKVISGSRGRVDASALLQTLKTGGVGVSQLSNEQFYLGLEPIIQEFGGQRTGTGIMSIYQNLVQSRGTVTAQQELYRLGLLDKSKVQFNQLGQLKKALPGAFQGSEVLEREGPLALLQKVLLPAFARKGITTEEGILREIGMILGNRTGSSLMSRIYQQRGTITMQSEANRNALDIDQLTKTGMQTPAGKMLELHAKWRDVLRELGDAVLPIAIKAVEGLTGIIKVVRDIAKEFPLLTKMTVIAFASLSALVAVGGAVTLATAGFRALGLAMVVGKAAGIGGMLLESATAFGAIGLALGGIGLAAAAIFGVYEAVKYLNEKDKEKHPGQHWVSGGFSGKGGSGKRGHWAWNDTGKMDWDAPSMFRNPFNKDGAPDSRYVAPSGKKPVTINTTVTMDGKKVGKATVKHLVDFMGASQAGTADYDGRQALAPAGSTF